MNQEKNIGTKAESQTRQGIKDAFAESYQSFIRLEQIRIVTLNTSSANRPRQGGGFNIFLIQNLGKGPPGRTRSPVTACCLIPDNQPVSFMTTLPELWVSELVEDVEGSTSITAALKAAKLVKIQYFNILIFIVIQIFTSFKILQS